MAIASLRACFWLRDSTTGPDSFCEAVSSSQWPDHDHVPNRDRHEEICISHCTPVEDFACEEMAAVFCGCFTIAWRDLTGKIKQRRLVVVERQLALPGDTCLSGPATPGCVIVAVLRGDNYTTGEIPGCVYDGGRAHPR